MLSFFFPAIAPIDTNVFTHAQLHRRGFVNFMKRQEDFSVILSVVARQISLFFFFNPSRRSPFLSAGTVAGGAKSHSLWIRFPLAEGENKNEKLRPCFPFLFFLYFFFLGEIMEILPFIFACFWVKESVNIQMTTGADSWFRRAFSARWCATGFKECSSAPNMAKYLQTPSSLGAGSVSL